MKESLAFGHLGEPGALEAWIGFIFGMLGWFYILKGIFGGGYILKEIFMGEAGGVTGECSQAVKESLAFGYLGETGALEAWFGFILGMLGWFYVLKEIFVGGYILKGIFMGSWQGPTRRWRAGLGDRGVGGSIRRWQGLRRWQFFGQGQWYSWWQEEGSSQASLRWLA